MKDLGPLHYFLGIQVDSTEDGLFLSQGKYAEDILYQAGMSDCNPMPTPLPLQLFTDAKPELFPEPSYFRSLAGKLQYLTLTRPDIQFAVNFVCQRMHEPTQSDFTLLKRLLRYIRGTSSFGIHISKSVLLDVSAFSDSDWVGCKETRRLTTGFCTYLGDNLVSWSAKKQTTVSRSSTEAKYRAMAETCAELTWIAFLLCDVHLLQSRPAVLKCDNLSAVQLTINPSFHARTKHFETDWHYTRERVAIGFVETRHISAAQQTAYIFTKSLPRKAFTALRDKLRVGSLTTLSLKGGNSSKQQNMGRDSHKLKREEKRPMSEAQVVVKTLNRNCRRSDLQLTQKESVGKLSPPLLYNRFQSLCVKSQ